MTGARIRPARSRAAARCRWSGALALPVLLVLLVLPTGVPALGATTPSPPLWLDGSGPHPLAGHLEVRSDPERGLTLAEVLADPGAFVPIPGNLAGTYGTQAVWVRFRLIRAAEAPADFYLRLGPPVLDDLTVAVQVGEGASADAFQAYRLGDHRSAAARPVLHPAFIVPLDLPAGRPRWVYVRIAGGSALMLFGTVLTPAALVGETARQLALRGGWVGVASLVALVSLYFAGRLREPLYGWHGAYVLALCINRIGAEGLPVLFLPHLAHHLADALVAWGGVLAVLCLSRFLLGLYEPELRRGRRVLLAMGAGPALVLPFGGWGAVALPTLGVAILLLMLAVWCSLRRALSGGVWLYVAAFTVVFLAIAVNLLRMAGWVATAWWNLRIIEAGFLAHIVLLALALAEQVRQAAGRARLAEQNARREALKMAKDMTRKLRASQQELRATVERERQFVAMVSHEYRTPLAIIRANLDLLKMLAQDRQQVPVGDLVLATDRMNRAVGRLTEVLEVSLEKVRLADESLRVERKPLALGSFMEEVLGLVRGYWPDRPFALVAGPGPGPLILADPLLLKTALLNLLDNAAKYSPAESPVTVRLCAVGTTAEVAVSDQGPGIPPGHRERVFEKFYRIPGQGEGRVGGAGLGLYLVARIMDEHGGQAAVSPDPVGTTITLRLPLHHAPAPHARGTPDDRTHRRTAGRG